jgi:hypothetical protein
MLKSGGQFKPTIVTTVPARANTVADLPPRHALANSRNTANDLVPGDQGAVRGFSVSND